MKKIRDVFLLNTFLALTSVAGAGCPSTGTAPEPETEPEVQPEAEPDITPQNCVATEDADSDGLDDCAEVRGWEVVVDRVGDGTTVSETVTSNPLLADTDGDGLGDLDESNSRTDPNRSDTDADGLPDPDEINRYRSDPRDVDTDDDARGPDGESTPNPSLFDGNELNLSGTSPTLADTDGDNKDDYEEVIGGGSNPLRADVPRLEISFVGDLSIDIARTESTNCTTIEMMSQTTLESDASSFVKTDTTSSKATIEQNAEIKTELEAKVGTSDWPPGGTLTTTATASVSAATVQENGTSLTVESKASAQNDYRALFESNCVTAVNFDSATVNTQIDVVNTGTFAFNLADLTISLQRINRDGASFSVVATQTVFAGEAALDIGSGQTVASVPVSFDITLTDARDLLRDPSELTPIVSQYTMTNQEGLSYAYLNDTTIERTGLLVIDFGDGVVERHLIATNVERNMDGTAAGIRLGDALTLLGYVEDDMGGAGAYTTRATTTADGSEVRALSSLNGTADDATTRRFWLLAGSNNTFGGVVDFNDLVLNQGDIVFLSLLIDTDDDGLYDREERLYGTRVDNSDTDADTLNDFDEIRTGWLHGVTGERVFPSATNPDPDGDGAADATERDNSTDPRDPDSDGDGIGDNIEILSPSLDPLNPDTPVFAADYAGNGHSFHVRADGTLWAWGSNGYGELLNNTSNPQELPVPIQGMTWSMVSAGNQFTVGLDADGQLWAGGFGIADGEPDLVALPVPVDGPVSFRSVAAGGDIAAVADNGSIWFFDVDFGGEVLAGTQVGPDIDWVRLSAGYDHYVAVKADGSLWAWGGNGNGQLGLGDETPRSEPTRIGFDNDWMAPAAGPRFSCAIRQSRTLWCWGGNTEGQLGLGDQSDRATPVHVCLNVGCGTLDEPLWGAVTMGPEQQAVSVIALQLDGTLWTWGRNSSGQLGLGDTLRRTTPQRVGTDTDWALVSISTHVLAVKASGTLWGWGQRLGLGLGAGADVLVPTQIGTDSDWNPIGP